MTLIFLFTKKKFRNNNFKRAFKNFTSMCRKVIL